MDKLRGKISNMGLAAIIFLSSGMMIHVFVIPLLMDFASRDAWISVLVAAPFFITWILLLFKFIHTLNGKPFIIWVKEKWGKLGQLIVTLITMCFLLFTAVITTVDTMIWTISTYMQNTPYIVISGVLIVVSLLLAYNGIQAITIVASILLPVVVFLGYFISIVNIKHKDYSLLLPMLEQGYSPVLQGAIYAFISLCDCWIILYISHLFKSTPTMKFRLGFSLFLVMLFVGPIIGGITEFGPVEASDQRYTVFDQWKLLSLGRFLPHLDFLSIYQWLSGAFIRITLSIYLFVELLTFHGLKNKGKVFIFLFFLIGGSMFLQWRSDVTLTLLRDYYFPINLVVLLTMTFFILITVWVSPSKKGKQDGKQNDKQSGTQNDKQSDKQTDKQNDKQSETQTTKKEQGEQNDQQSTKDST